MRLIISGSLAYDRIMDFDGLFADHILPDKVHELSVSFFVPTLTESFGGNAGNIAYTLSLLDVRGSPMTSAGNDFAPYKEWLQKSGVDTSLIQTDEKARTAFASIMTDKGDNQITAFYPGAMQNPYPLEKAAIGKDDFVVVGTSGPETLRLLPALCRERAHGFIYDPGQQIPTLSAEELKDGIEGARALMVNDYELELILQKTGWSEEDIVSRAEALIVTLGGKGSRIRTKTETIPVPAAAARTIVDPTGAGDAYRAGFIAARVKGLPLNAAAKAGAVAACYAIETKGTQNHRFTKEEFAERYEENFKEPIAL